MSTYKSHLTILQHTAASYPHAPVFKVPQLDSSTGQVHHWSSISYAQFTHDVDFTARYWRHVLKSDGVPDHSVVGLWLSGTAYQDVLNIYALSRAAYVPQLFSVRLPNPDVVLELLVKADAKALILDSQFHFITSSFPLPVHLAIKISDMPSFNYDLPPIRPTSNPDKLVFIFHTSGSTSGSPSLVHCNSTWLNAIISKANVTCAPRDPHRQDVSVWMGSMCHIGQTFMFIGALQHGSCIIQPTKIAFTSEELVDMIHRCQLNRLNQFSTFLSIHLRSARQNPKLLRHLQTLDEILYSGLPLPRQEEDWGYKNGLNMKNLFGSTECGAMLLSVGGKGQDAPLLRPIPGTSYAFLPLDTDTQYESEHKTSSRMLELVILSSSGDCPHPSLRGSDGHFHTGDLFQQLMPGSYAFRGRNDDWIKSENSLRCDTKAIEDNVRATCGDLIEECIVVGTGRPSPALLVEPAPDVNHEKLKRDIIRKTRQFHVRRYLHEQITNPNLIIIVPSKSLARTATKGNIRRKAVEEAYEAELDGIYASLRENK